MKRCPLCGKKSFETFTAGDGETSVRDVDHIDCVVETMEAKLLMIERAWVAEYEVGVKTAALLAAQEKIDRWEILDIENARDYRKLSRKLHLAETANKRLGKTNVDLMSDLDIAKTALDLGMGTLRHHIRYDHGPMSKKEEDAEVLEFIRDYEGFEP